MTDPIWSYPSTTGLVAGASLVGYKVEATDGSIGKVDKHSDEAGSAFVVVDTGPWIFGKQVLLPAGTVTGLDSDEEKIYVNRTRQQIKDAPEFDQDTHLGDVEYQRRVGDYYGRPNG